MSLRISLTHYFARHFQDVAHSYAQLRGTPLASFMTLAVIGIALALPACLMVILQNVSSVSHGWKQDTQISLFLTQTITTDAVNDLLAKIKLHENVASTNYISPQQGLQELESQGDFKNIISQLPSNPLPPVIEVFPAHDTSTPEQVANLYQELQHFPGVVSAKLDMQWVQRLYSIITLAQRGVMALIALLALAVVLVISNTIRLATQNRRKEIEVLKLIGATNGFIRRPFLYTGIAYGLGGGIFAWLLVCVLIIWLSVPVAHLASLYNTQFEFHQLSSARGLSLLVLGACLGWLGSWVAVSRQLSRS